MPTIGYATLQVIPSMQGIEGRLNDLVGGPASQAGDNAGRAFSGGFSNALKIGAVVVGAVAAVGAGLYAVGGIFDDVTDTIRTGTGATGEALDGLVTSAKNVGTQIPAEFDKIGPTIADLNTRLGLTGPTLEKVASQYLEAGRILGEEVDISATTGAFSAFRIEGDAVVGAMDTLFQVSQATGVGMNELAGIVQTAAPAMQNLGFGFEETAALAGTLDRAGIDSTKTLAGMSKALVTLAKDGEAPPEAFRRVTSELQGMVAEGRSAEAIDLASTLFGTRGAAQFVGAVQSGKLNLDDLVASAGLSGDSILAVGEDTADLAEQFTMFKNNALVTIEPVATSLFSALGEGMAWLNSNGVPALTAFAAVAGERLAPAVSTVGGFVTGTLVPGITTLAGFVTGTLVPGLSDAATWLRDNATAVQIVGAVIGTLLLPVLVSMGVAYTTAKVQAVGAWLASSSAAVTSSAAQVAAHYRIVGGWVLSGAAAVKSGAETVAIWALYKIEAARAAATTVAQAAVAAGAWVAGSARTVGAIVAQNAALVASRAVMVAGAAATGIVTVAQWAWNAALTANPIGIVVVAIAALVGALIYAWNNSETFRAVVIGAWEGIKSVVSSVGSWFTTTVPAWWQTVLGATRATWDAVTGVFDTVRARVSSAVQQVLGVVQTVFSYTPIGFVISNFDAIVGFFRGIPDKVRAALDAAPEMLRRAGTAIIQGLADGITAGLGKVTGAVRDVLAKARDLLPFSPAKTGPFSGKGWTLFSGRSVSAAFGQGITDEGDKPVRAMRAVLARVAGLSAPEVDPGSVLAYRAPTPPASPSDEERAAARRRRGGGGDNPGGITINGNVGWTLDEVERQRRTRNRRRATVRGIATVAAGRA